MVDPHYWAESDLLITVAISKDFYTILCRGLTQDEFVEKFHQQYPERFINILNIVPLTEDAADLVAEDLRNRGYAQFIYEE